MQVAVNDKPVTGWRKPIVAFVIASVLGVIFGIVALVLTAPWWLAWLIVSW